jgi:2-polyprenyl-3-methyl-5-hydroxy-6-metoxy-1,4-benzoquinol methylase
VSDDVTFTGERLHAGDALFAVDLARHEAAYEIARQRLPTGRVLDLGCGTGYGTHWLAQDHAQIFGLDRIFPEHRNRGAGRFVRADLRGIPLAPRSFDLVASFQVIEHLIDPTPYLEAIASLVSEDGRAILTTPNILMSDGVNPYHVHEYRADELEALLRRYFASVEMLGIGASEPVHAYLAARSRRIRNIMRLDPLGLRNLLPTAAVEWLFARFAVLVRSRTGQSDGTPEVTPADFPVTPPDSRSLDLLAICHTPLL